MTKAAEKTKEMDSPNPERSVADEFIKSEESERLDKEAVEIYKSGKFIEYATTAFHKVWCGDERVFHWMMIQFANGFIANADEGLHLYIAGSSGVGKSEGVKQSFQLFPSSYIIKGSFSRKAILYLAEKMVPGSILFHDDHIIDEDEAELSRGILASWKDGWNYYTVDKQIAKGIAIPKRISRIITNAESLSDNDSDGQDESRFITIEISRSKYDMRKIIEFINTPDKPDISHECVIARRIWSHIIGKNATVTIPYQKDIYVDDSAITKIREFKKFISAIRSIALLNGRTEATTGDFYDACSMWGYVTVMQDNEGAGLTRIERIVFDTIAASQNKTILLSELCNKLSTIKQPNIYRALRGRDGSFENVKGGLLSKIRGLRCESYYDRDTKQVDKLIRLLSNNNDVTVSPYLLKCSD